MAVTPEQSDCLGAWPEHLLDLKPEGEGRRRGQQRMWERIGWASGWGGEKLRLSHRRLEGVSGAEVRVQFNPALQTRYGCAMLSAFLRDIGVDPGAMWVERVDVAHDLRGEDRHRFVLDGGLHRPDHYGITSRGPQTERVGFKKGSKRRGQIYDKRAERMAAGDPDPGAWMRFELQAFPPFSRVDSAADAAAGDLRLSDLRYLEWPAEPGWAVREFTRDPIAYGDQRWLALGCVAMVYGTRVAEATAFQLLGGSQGAVREKTRFVAWPEVEPSPRVAFDRQWAAVAARVLDWLADPVRLPDAPWA